MSSINKTHSESAYFDNKLNIFSNLLFLDHLVGCLKIVFDLPKDAGNSRQLQPVLILLRITSKELLKLCLK